MTNPPSLAGTSKNYLSSPSNMNHRALRKARKSAAKAARDNEVSMADEQKACVEALPTVEPQPTEDTIQYECCICGDDFTFSEGVAHCAEHFMCNDCVVAAYDAALADTEAFPAQCCTTLPRRLVEHLLSPEVREAYSIKAEEYCTPRAVRVYCVNEHCLSFIPRSRVDNDDTLSTVARCACGFNTCVGCEYEWEGQDHRCVVSDVPEMRPKWMPEYSNSYRAKTCPNCRVWMEHKEACNHMTCHYCRHALCFVYLLPWTSESFHQDKGGPSYGDPVEGYDEEGYERGFRGLHRDNGYNRAGINRLGEHQLSNAIADENSFIGEGDYKDPDHDDYGYDEENHGEEPEYGGDQPELRDDEPADGQPSDDEIEDDQAALVNGAVPVEITIVSLPDPAGPRPRPRPSPPSNLVRQQIRLRRRVPIFSPNPHAERAIFDGGTPSFQQLECHHSWRREMLYRTESHYARCRGCEYVANSWTNYCSICGLVACDWCSQSFRHRFVAQWECAANLVDIIIWAEQGAVPFKAECRRASEELKDELWADCDGDGVGLATMMEVYETRQLQPFLYRDFGIRLLFEELELEMRDGYWPVTENVGVAGLALIFNLATNFFAPLCWEK